jgi:GNAT superfamily N-acetyltransferase
MFVVEVEGKARGSVYGIRGEGDARVAGVAGMWVASAFRGLGLGRALLEAALGWARSEDFSAVRLWVPAHSDRARSLYSGAGFVSTAASRQIRGATPFIAIEMLLDLGPREMAP